MMKKYNTPSVSVRTIIMNDKGEFLMVKEKKGYYSLPGGYCEINESLKEAAIRECLEETGYLVAITKLVAALNINKKEENEYALFFVGKIIKYVQEHDDEIIDTQYFSEDCLPKLSPVFGKNRLKKVLETMKNNDVLFE